MKFCERQALIPKEQRLHRSAEMAKKEPIPASKETIERIRKQERLLKDKVFDSDLSE